MPYKNTWLKLVHLHIAVTQIQYHVMSKSFSKLSKSLRDDVQILTLRVTTNIMARTQAYTSTSQM